MENQDRGDLLNTLSDDEGEPEDDEEEDDVENNEDDSCNEDDEEEDGSMKENGVIDKDSPTKPKCSAEVMSFVSSPSVEKLLQLGETRVHVQHQVEASDPHKAAELLLRISSLYSEHPETKEAVLETIDAVMKKCLSGAALQSYSFLSALLVLMGLLKGEGKIKKVPLIPGQLLCLEHTVQQNYFKQDHASLLHTFLSKNSKVLESCSGARDQLMSALCLTGSTETPLTP